jgi:hypothetical protein
MIHVPKVEILMFMVQVLSIDVNQFKSIHIVSKTGVINNTQHQSINKAGELDIEVIQKHLVNLKLEVEFNFVQQEVAEQ